MMKRLFFIFVINALANLGFILPAYAYLDPGTGSMILQLFIAGIAGALVMVKIYWYKLKRLFMRGPEPPDGKSVQSVVQRKDD